MGDIKRHSPPVGPLGPEVYRTWGFHQSVSWGGMIHYSGIAPLRGDDPGAVECVGVGDMRAQTIHVLDSLAAFLAADGVDSTRVLSWTFYVTDIAEFMGVQPVITAWAGEHLPAATLVQVAGLAHPDQRIEITAFAAGPEAPTQS
jgi:enamine deaminase RidA (YjgF/YER057c/UK114 family)